ncbi:hypothetical protein ACIOKD_39765 [Streptomyces sp. NPDC087844]|uniref:hypothetical protein n=1 Tax=Streptomyces sp. NPDC087844 TaxID=3365805 RepID=UPI0038305025
MHDARCTMHGVMVHRTVVGRRLVAEGYGRYASGPGPVWTPAGVLSYAARQRGLGHGRMAADGIPGPRELGRTARAEHLAPDTWHPAPDA